MLKLSMSGVKPLSDHDGDDDDLDAHDNSDDDNDDGDDYDDGDDDDFFMCSKPSWITSYA